MACGDDGGSNSGTNGEKGEVITLADGSGETVCDDKLDGWVAEAVGKDFRRCQNGEWTKITANEASAEDEIIGGVTVLQSSSSSVLSDMSSSSSTLTLSSSSAFTTSSSSTTIEDPSSSSSINVPEPAEGSSSSKPAWQYLNPDIDYSEFTDSRDGQVYKTVTIGTQTWMAENLNYRYVGVKYNLDGYTSDSTSWCGGGRGTTAGDCSIYGRLYTWAAAMDSAGIVDPSGAGKGCGYGKTCTVASASSATKVCGVCPSDWYLPSNAEWSDLYEAVGGTSSAGQKLKANTSLWNGKTSTNVYGFSVLPAGSRYGNGTFRGRGDYAGFWSSTEYEDYSDNAWNQYFNYNVDDVGQVDGSENLGFSVRCLRD